MEKKKLFDPMYALNNHKLTKTYFFLSRKYRIKPMQDVKSHMKFQML